MQDVLVNKTQAPTIEGILQRRDIGVFKFDIVVCPPGNPFPVKRHQVSLPIDVLKQLEGVFKKQRKARTMTSLMQRESLPDLCFDHTVEHAVCYWSTWHNRLVVAVQPVGCTVCRGILERIAIIDFKLDFRKLALPTKQGNYELCQHYRKMKHTQRCWQKPYCLQRIKIRGVLVVLLSYCKISHVSKELFVIPGHAVLPVVLEVVGQTIIKENRPLRFRKMEKQAEFSLMSCKELF